ncbi:MAG: hypothetical protein MH204_06090 [Fimbriimonadaceae bacterium]|nr:hypothetical protein [Fimbriimonadaceae bacterium]
MSLEREMEEEFRKAFPHGDELVVHSDWRAGLESAVGADMMVVDFLTTLAEPHKVAGYEAFAEAKLDHPEASGVPLVLIWPPEDYQIDFMTGYPGLIFQSMQRPVTFQKFRRAATYLP